MDDEISGMYQVAKILEGLDEDARARVIRWAADKYDIDLNTPLDSGERAADEVTFMDVDADKVAAAKAAGEGGESEAESGEFQPKVEVEPASILGGETQLPPAKKDPEKPSFLDTQFRMYAGKKRLKKEQEDK